MKSRVDCSIGSRHMSNTCGEYEIIKLLDERTADGHLQYEVEFINTHYRTITSSHCITSGAIRDLYAKTVCNGIACMGQVEGPRSVYEKEDSRWRKMLDRCYNPNSQDYLLYGGAGITVCGRWLCFEYYYEDIKKLPNYDKYIANPDDWQLDKDALQQGVPKNQMVYSPETCMWLPNRLNAFYAVSKEDCRFGYYGVGLYFGNPNQYTARVYQHAKEFIIGVYTTPEDAASAYNYYISVHYPYLPLNTSVPTFTAEEVYERDIRKNKNEMCRIVKNDHPFKLFPQFAPDYQQPIAAKEITPSDIWKRFIQQSENNLTEMCHSIQK